MRFYDIEIEPHLKEKDGIRIDTEFVRNEDVLTVRFIAKNIGEDISLGTFPLFCKVKLFGTYTKIYSESRDMLGEVGINGADKTRTSFGILGFTDDFGTQAVLLGFENFKDYFYRFQSIPQSNGFEITVNCDFQGATLAGGGEIVLSDLKVYFSNSLSQLLKRHALTVATSMNARTGIRNADLGMGWCSWYYYYGTETNADIMAATEDLTGLLSAEETGFILVDDGWNQRENDVCVWGDWEAGFKYPQGMKAVCDNIHGKGLKAGIWLAPFAVSRKSALFSLHPEWVIGGKENILNPNEGVFGLDLSNPDVLQYIRRVFERVFDEWGFDLVKIDFLLYGAGEGTRYDKYCSGVQAYRKGLQVIRACAGEKLIFGCGCPVLQSVGLCDVLRIGSDVGSRWHFPLNEDGWPDGNCSIKCSARYTVYRNWMNGVFWLNDPDCIVVRDKSNGIEQTQFCKFFPYMPIEESGFGLSDNEADLWVKLIAFTGGVEYLSERWNELPVQRQKLVLEYFRKRYLPCSVVDYYEHRDLYLLQNENAIAVFNTSDQDISLRLSEKTIENAETMRTENGLEIGKEGNEYVFPLIKARSGYIFERQ